MNEIKTAISKLIYLRHDENTRDHELIAAIDELEIALTASADSASPEPSFFVIVDAERHAEFVTNLRHEAQEHINDACEQGVDGAGKWKAVPVFEMRPTDDRLWEQTLRDRDTYHEWADKLAEAIAKHFGADIGEHSNMNCPWSEALEVIESADSAQDERNSTAESIIKDIDELSRLADNMGRSRGQNNYCNNQTALNKFVDLKIALEARIRALLADKAGEQEPVIWEGAEGWEPLAFALCEEEHDDPHQLIYDGYPPEPWGEVWQKYEGDAKRMIQMVRKYTATQPNWKQTREPWMPYLSERADGCKGRYAIARWNPAGYQEVWNLLKHKWAAFSDDVLTLEQAQELMRNVTIPTAQQAQQDELAYIAACNLAKAIHAQHYREDSPHWRVLPDIRGVISQIDNMVAGMTRRQAQQEAGKDAEPLNRYCATCEQIVDAPCSSADCSTPERPWPRMTPIEQALDHAKQWPKSEDVQMFYDDLFIYAASLKADAVLQASPQAEAQQSNGERE